MYLAVSAAHVNVLAHLDPSTIAAILTGAVSPFAVEILTKLHASSSTKRWVALVIAALAGVLPTVAFDPSSGWGGYVLNLALALAVQQSVHRTGITDSLARATANVGIGGPPTPPPPPDDTDPGWSDPGPVDPSMPPVGATPRSSDDEVITGGEFAAGSALTGTFLSPEGSVFSPGVINVHNPAPEPASKSVAAAVLKGIRDDTDRGALPEPVPHGKLGKRRKPRDTRDFKAARWIDRANLPRVPSSRSWDDAVLNDGGGYHMLLNDRLGDCVIAAALHMAQTWRANVGQAYQPTDETVLRGYEAVGGYNPADPDTDRGCVEREALNYWRKTGFQGHKITAFGAVPPHDHDLVKIAVDLFGGVMFGFDLPLSVMGKDHWSVGRGAPAQAGSWGGHGVPAVAYDSRHLWVVSWGAVYPVTWSFVDRYADEAWAAVSADWLKSGAVSPSGFDAGQLNADLSSLG